MFELDCLRDVGGVDESHYHGTAVTFFGDMRPVIAPDRGGGEGGVSCVETCSFFGKFRRKLF